MTRNKKILESLFYDKEASEHEIREDQSKHHNALLVLTKAYDIMTALNQTDYRIEQQILHVMSLIQDKDGRMTGNA
jgi:hypothetical protein